jgi:maltooligosyltrehalose trehalohydrolase
MIPTSTLGARLDDGGVHFAVWSDKAHRVTVVLYARPGEATREVALERDAQTDIFQGFVAELQAGALYDFRLDGVVAVDPYARALPFGVRGPARVEAALAGRAFPGRRIELDGSDVFYELHVGTFTPEGTFEGAARRLRDLRELGITVVELMPIAAFPGARGWGYDGVGLFAPFAPYGSPEQLQAFLETAHAEGLSVVLDVVYNHLGPDGNALPVFSDGYFDVARKNPWGAAPDLEKPAFRRLILDNARHWLQGFGFDGLRLDATHELEPGGTPHILSELAALARSCSPPAALIAEDSRNDPRALLSHGIDAVWSDDFHHAAHVLLTDEHEGYYQAFAGDLAELARVIERGQAFEGQTLPGSNLPRRGRTTEGVPLGRFLFALQNHDQVGNRARGERLHALVALPTFRAASLLLLFLPSTPLLFMGQEWASSTPFLYFSDHAGPLGDAVSRGRREEFGHFSAFRHEDPSTIPDPQAQATFEHSKLNWSERSQPEHAWTLDLYRRALQLRRTDPVLREPSEASAGSLDGVLWVVRRGRQGERLILFNPGAARSMAETATRLWPGSHALLSTHPLSSELGAFELPASSATIYSLANEPKESSS